MYRIRTINFKSSKNYTGLCIVDNDVCQNGQIRWPGYEDLQNCGFSKGLYFPCFVAVIVRTSTLTVAAAATDRSSVF